MTLFLHSAALDRKRIEATIERAREFRDGKRADLSDKIIGLLFFENSSRTRVSFEMAGMRLGARIVFLGPEGSSIKKGETELDTAKVLSCNGVDAMVVRTSVNDGPAQIAASIDVPVINAGSGVTDHPSQGLLDAMTLLDHFNDDIDGKTIAIVGDIAHSRVVRANAHILTKLGAHVRFVGADAMLPDASEDFPRNVTRHADLKDGLDGADAVMALRIQRERFDNRPDLIAACEALSINHDTIALAKPGAVVLHPMPMNRDVEISGALADDLAYSLLWKQMENGLFIRMAMFEAVMS